MNEINEIKLPKGVESISVTQHDDRVVIEFIPEKPRFKNGDFVYEDERVMIVKSYPTNYHALVLTYLVDGAIYDSKYGVDFSEQTFRHATEDEKQLLIDAMRKDGKRWNDDKKCIEEIHKPKFKAGDKVKIKDGISSKTHLNATPCFIGRMDELIGKMLTIDYIANDRCRHYRIDGWLFAEDWLEPWSYEPKNGDLSIFWDDTTDHALIRIYDRKDNEYHYDSSGPYGSPWKNAIKFESKEQFEKLLRGEI